MRGNDDDSPRSCDDDATGEGVLLIGTGEWYCSIDEYSCRCNPQGAKGSDGVVTRGGSRGGGLGVGMTGGANGDGSTRGGGGIGMVAMDPLVDGVGGGMKVGDNDLSLAILLRLWRSFRSLSRNG